MERARGRKNRRKTDRDGRKEKEKGLRGKERNKIDDVCVNAGNTFWTMQLAVLNACAAPVSHLSCAFLCFSRDYSPPLFPSSLSLSLSLRPLLSPISSSRLVAPSFSLSLSLCLPTFLACLLTFSFVLLCFLLNPFLSSFFFLSFFSRCVLSFSLT